ncbi:OmpA family protein, partial [Legionella jordanis]|uniref:OmpA family protein n=1 Tax=Legionella jordanis TaxID=456 RepID=UPI000F3E06D5
ACFNIDRIWLSLNFDFFMQNLLAHTLRENSTFGINYFVGGLPIDQYNLNENGKVALSKLANVLEKYLPCMAITDKKYKYHCGSLNLASQDGLDAVFIEGHTDVTGSSDHNWYLSTRRAISIFKELTEAKPFLNEGVKNINGIPILNVSGYEARRPVDPNRLELNRRIELRFIMRSPTPEDLEKLHRAIR